MYFYTRGDRVIQPSQVQNARSSFESQLRQALGGQPRISDEALAFALGVAGTAYTCAETRASIGASIPLYVGDLDENPIEDEQNQLRWFVTIQSPIILYYTVYSLLIWGRAYLRKQRNADGWPTGLAFLYPTDIIYEHVDRATGSVTGYDHLDPVTFRVEHLSKSDVIYMQVFDSDSSGMGISRFEVAWRKLHVQLGIDTFSASFFINNAAPDGVLTLEGENGTDKEVLATAELQWKKFKSAKNAHRTAVLPTGMKWTPIQSAPRDLAMSELDASSTKHIHAIFQVHPALTGAEDVGDPLSAQSTYSSIEVSHIRNVAIPLLRLVILPALNSQWSHVDLDRSMYYTLYVDETRIPALAEANLTKITGAKEAKDALLLDYNEAREIFGYEAREEGEYFIRSVAEAVSAWQAGGISLNQLIYYTRGVKSTDPNGEVRMIGGQIVPTARLLELANANVERMKGPSVLFTPLGGGSPPPAAQGLTVTKPPVPVLPSGDSQPEERGAGESLCIALGFANHPDLVGLQQLARTMFLGQPVEWKPADDFHTTLLYAPVATDDQVRTLLMALRVLQLPEDIALRIGSLNSFDRLGRHSIHYLIRKNDDLLDFQERLYNYARWAGIGIASRTTPGPNYKPHVTMGELGTRPHPVTFDPKLSITPDELWVYRGDRIVHRMPLKPPALPAPQQPVIAPPEVVQPRSYVGAPTMGTPGATALLTFADVSAIMSHQQALRFQVSESLTTGDGGVRWTAVDALHMTLLTALVIDDTQLVEIICTVEPSIVPGMVMKAGPVSAFEQGEYNVLILPIHSSEQLDGLQRMLHEQFEKRGIPLSRYSAPEHFIGHITLGYLPKHIPVPTSDQVFEVTPNALVVSRESYETVYSLPFAVIDAPAPQPSPGEAVITRSAERAADPLEVVVGFPDAQAVRYARRELDRFLVDLDYANPRWIDESDWALNLVSLERWTPSEAAKLVREADFGGTRRIDLWTQGYGIDGNTLYLRIEESPALEALRTSVALDVQGAGRTPMVPGWVGIPLCEVDAPVDLANAPFAHYPLVVDNVSLRKGSALQHQWTLRHAPPQSENELTNWRKLIRKHGWEYAFERQYLRGSSAELFVLAGHEADIDDDELFALAEALLRGEWTLRAYTDTRQDFINAIRDLFLEGQASEISRRKFGAQLRMYLRGYGLQAYRDGMNAAGYDPESLSTDEVAIFRRWQDEQSAYVTGLGTELFGPGISAAVVEQRVRMWADISLNEIRLRGVAVGNSEKRFRWTFKPGADHCDECKHLDGQVHTITEWLDAGLYPGSGRTGCKQGCQCGFTMTDDPIRGSFLRSDPPAGAAEAPMTIPPDDEPPIAADDPPEGSHDAE